ncbi:MAG: hypothetical protein JO041_16410 [Acidobacteria bacterium]|nr:hypothetical protein [Acidobacteriota bacterium]
MATEGEIRPDDIRNPETHHEPRTFNTRGVLLFLAFMVICALFIHLLVVGLYNILSSVEPTMRTANNPVMTGPPPVSPPPPVLQPDPVADLHQMRAQEDQILQGYAWIDQRSGKVRIPIARAMQLLAERGLPQAAGPAPAPSGTAVPK